MCLSSLKLSQLRVVHFIALEHELLVGRRHIRSLDNKVDVSLFGKLQIIEVINIFSLQIDSYYTLLPI